MFWAGKNRSVYCWKKRVRGTAQWTLSVRRSHAGNAPECARDGDEEVRAQTIENEDQVQEVSEKKTLSQALSLDGYRGKDGDWVPSRLFDT
ncbi:hypothetical protein E4U54_007035 [Claviceps lovelessii]|nr:hypothetical protein E4U54_007035 [Claviceps lovelessii]